MLQRLLLAERRRCKVGELPQGELVTVENEAKKSLEGVQVISPVQPLLLKCM
jgi:hypothetical protein